MEKVVVFRDIPVSVLRMLLQHDPDTGWLTWLPRPREMFSGDRHWRMWNTRFATKRAFTATNRNGYHCGSIGHANFYAHRVIWALHYGRWPEDQIDHINGNRTDNRVINLREVTNLQNGRNVKLHNTNTSGHIGVRWHKAAGKWVARIVLNGKHIHLGLFDSVTDAVAARTQSQIKHGFHSNHGRK